MSDERITNVREAHMIEILGNVSGLEEQVKAIHAELGGILKQLKDVRQTAIDEIRAIGSAEKNKLASEGAKLVRDGVFSETDNLKKSIDNAISKNNQAADKLDSRLRTILIVSVLSSALGASVATFLIERIMLNH